MNVIAKREVMKAAAKMGLGGELQDWYNSARQANWRSLSDVRKEYPSADMVGDLIVFDIQHNKFRLIVRVAFKSNMMFFKGLVTHKEYSRGEWKTWK